MEISYQEVYRMNLIQARLGLVRSYQQSGSIAATAREWHTSRQVVRKWLRRYNLHGEGGLCDLSRRPHHCPRQTAPGGKERVVKLHTATGYGRKRLAWELFRSDGLAISPNTIRHILSRHQPDIRTKRKRKPFYPAHWAWEKLGPFALAQVDTKDIMDKNTLGTELWTHIARCRLPRYQWTFCEAKSRLRFIAFSRQLTLTNGLAFFYLVMLHLRSCGITNEIIY